MIQYIFFVFSSTTGISIIKYHFYFPYKIRRYREKNKDLSVNKRNNKHF